MNIPGIRKSARSGVTRGTLGSLSNDDGDVNENGKKAIDLDWQTTTLHVHHAFLYFSLSSLHDYDVKIPNFTFFSFSELRYSLLEFNSRKNCQHLRN